MKQDSKQPQRPDSLARANRVLEQARLQLGRVLAGALATSLEALGERLGADRPAALPDPSKVADQPRHRLRRMLQSDRGLGPRIRGPENEPRVRGPENEPRVRGPENEPRVRGPESEVEWRPSEPDAELRSFDRLAPAAAYNSETKPDHGETLETDSPSDRTGLDAAHAPAVGGELLRGPTREAVAPEFQHDPVAETHVTHVLDCDPKAEHELEAPTVSAAPEITMALDPAPDVNLSGVAEPSAQPRADAPSSEPDASSVQVCDEPIRTRSMARLLASQGHHQRALSIYAALLASNGSDTALQAEAAALRSLPDA